MQPPNNYPLLPGPGDHDRQCALHNEILLKICTKPNDPRGENHLECDQRTVHTRKVGKNCQKTKGNPHPTDRHHYYHRDDHHWTRALWKKTSDLGHHNQQASTPQQTDHLRTTIHPDQTDWRNVAGGAVVAKMCRPAMPKFVITLDANLYFCTFLIWKIMSLDIMLEQQRGGETNEDITYP